MIKGSVDYSIEKRSYIAMFEIPERTVTYTEQDIRMAVFERITTEIAKRVMDNVDITFKPKEGSK